MRWTVCLSLLLGLTSSLALGEEAPSELNPAPPDSKTMRLRTPSDAVAFAATVRAVDSRLTRFRVVARELEKHVAELAALARVINGEKSWSDLFAQDRRMHDKFPGSLMISIYKGRMRFEGFETDADRLRSRVQEVSQDLESAQVCTGALNQGLNPVPGECAGLIQCSDAVGWNADGFFRYEVVENYDVRRIGVASEVDLMDADERDGISEAFRSLKAEWLRLHYDRCKLLALLVPEAEPSTVSLRWKHTDKISWDLDRFRAVCSRPSSQQPDWLKLRELVARFPEDKGLAGEASSSEWVCNLAADAQCAHVFKIRETWAIAYPTRVCTVRRASVKDLHNDVAEWHATEVEKEEHLMLADRIEACHAASDAGYNWRFEEPSVAASCRKAKAPAPIQRPRTKSAPKSDTN